MELPVIQLWVYWTCKTCSLVRLLLLLMGVSSLLQCFVAGYNDVLLIPAGATNIRVEEIAPSNNYLGKIF